MVKFHAVSDIGFPKVISRTQVTTECQNCCYYRCIIHYLAGWCRVIPFMFYCQSCGCFNKPSVCGMSRHIQKLFMVSWLGFNAAFTQTRWYCTSVTL